MMKRNPEQFITDADGTRKSVILPLEDYEELLEDLHDLAVVAERRNEQAISFGEVKERLKNDGHL